MSYQVLWVTDDNFGDRMWEQYYDFTCELRTREGESISSKDWQSFKSRRMSLLQEEQVYHCAVIMGEGAIIGHFDFWMGNPEAQGDFPMISMDGLFESAQSSISDCIGPQLLSLLDDYGQEAAVIQELDERMHGVALSLGCETIGRGASYVLEIEAAQTDVMKQWLATIHPEQMDLQILTHKHLPEELVSEVAEVLTELRADVPQERDSGLRDQYTVEELQKDKEWSVQYQSPRVGCILMDRTGRVIGLSEIRVDEHRIESVNQMMTGVRREYRRQKLAKWLKAKLFFTLLDFYPSIRKITTSMMNINKPIKHLNSQMGFKAVRQHCDFKLLRSELAKRYGENC